MRWKCRNAILCFLALFLKSFAFKEHSQAHTGAYHLIHLIDPHQEFHDLAVRPAIVKEIKIGDNMSKIQILHKKPLDLVQTVRRTNFTSWATSNRIWKVSCNKHIKKHPADILCPATCPYVRSEPTRLCQFKCVPATSCNSDNPLASFANNETKRCEVCKVAGCHRCGATRWTCAVCAGGFVMTDDGHCRDAYRHYWTSLFVVLGIVGIIVVYYLLVLFFVRDAHANDVALKAGLKFRQSSTVRKMTGESTEKKMVSINLWRNLMKPHGDLVYGPAVMLQFRWMGAVLAWSIFALLLFLVACMMFSQKLAAINFHKPNSRKSFDACEENVKLREKEYNSMEVVFAVCIAILYLATVVGSLIFAAWQREAYHKTDFDAVTMKDFALSCSGFPVYGGAARVEQERLEFFKSQEQFKNLDIIGVSVCWDFRGKEDEIQEQITREFDFESSKLDDTYKTQTASAHIAEKEQRRHCGVDYQLRSLDAVLGVGSLPCAEPVDEEEPPAVEVRSLLDSIKTSGNLFLVMGTMVDKYEALNRIKENPLFFEHDGWKWAIEVKEASSEPTTVLWKGYGTKHLRFILSLVVGCIAVFLGVVILDIFFYAPYVIYIISLSDVPLMSQGGFVSSTLLGLLIAGCNQAIYFIIGAVTDRCGWTSTDSKDCFYCVKYTCAVFFNTLIDLGTVLILAQGYSVEMAMKMDIADDSTMSPKAVAEHPDLQYALYVQMVAYIFPSCMLLPFLLEPLFTAVVPYYLAKAVIRSRSEVTVQQAEGLLANPPYDLSRYGDIIINMMLACLMLMFTYTDLWMIFLYLAISIVVVYAWDQMRVLRLTTKTVFATASMDESVMYMMAMPCGVLASCMAFRLYGASHHGFLDDLRQAQQCAHNVVPGSHDAALCGMAPDRREVFWYVGGVFLLHCVLHWILLKHVVYPAVDKNLKLEEEPQGIYKDTNKKMAASYFNTNPVNCLRSKYIYEDSPPCIFYHVGKEHLLKKNKEIGLTWQNFFQVDDTMEAEDSAEETTMLGNLQSYARGGKARTET